MFTNVYKQTSKLILEHNKTITCCWNTPTERRHQTHPCTKQPWERSTTFLCSCSISFLLFCICDLF